MTSNKPIIYIENGVINHKENLILKDINLSVNEGEFLYLIGKTGSGKSSLLKVLYGDHFLSNGNGNVVDYDLTTLKIKDVPLLRRKIGIVFQDFQLLYDRSVEDNLKFVLKATGWKKNKEINVQIEKTLNLVGLNNKLYKMPHQLSGGEQQRVAIARALLNDPNLILADEPTGNLDPETSDEIMELLREINSKNVAILMATHDYRIIELFPYRILKCADQTVTELILSR